MYKLSQEELYELIANRIAYECEEDSWEKEEDLDTWDYEYMRQYYERYMEKAVKREGVKFDAEKLQPTLLPVESLEKIVEVLQFGAKKYSRDNWKKVEGGYERYFDALLRHLYSAQKGETNDEESGLSHLAHAGCCLLFLLHFEDKQWQGV